MSLMLLPMVWASQVPPCSFLAAEPRLELETRAKPGCSAVYPINHRQHGFSISSHCTSMSVMAVGLVRLLVTVKLWQPEQGTGLAISIYSVQVQLRASHYLIPWRSLSCRRNHHQLLQALPIWVTSLWHELWKNTSHASGLELLIFNFKPYESLLIVGVSKVGCAVSFALPTPCLLLHLCFWEPYC